MNKVIQEFQRDLSIAATSFVNEGLASFHRSASQNTQQVALVNIAIGCELLIKAYLARKSVALIFSDLSPEDQVALQCPKELKKGQRSNSAVKLKFREMKTRQFDDCLSMLYVFEPQLRERFGSGLKRISLMRNVGAHQVLSSHAVHEVDRSADVVLQLFEELKAEAKCWRPQNKEDAAFLKRFSAERNAAVKKAIEDARKRFQAEAFLLSEFDKDDCDWEEYGIECPVCGSTANLAGTTEYERSGRDPEDEMLTFFASSFECDGCGLKLGDEEEMRLAGIDTGIDRNDDLDRWHDGDEPYWPDDGE